VYKDFASILVEPIDAYINKGSCYKALNKYKEALEEFDKALKIKNDYSNAYYNNGILHCKF